MTIETEGLPVPGFFLERRDPYKAPWWKPFDLRVTPPDADWRNLTAPVRRQGDCQSCTAHAFAAMFEAAARKRTGQSVSISAPYIHFCIADLECQQGLDLKYLAEALPRRSAPPYGGSPRIEPGECGAAGGFVFSPLKEIFRDDEARSALAADSPVAVGMEVADNFRNLRTFSYAPQGEAVGHHSVCLVGYDGAGWIAKNSFGAGWGERGYFHIAYGVGGILRDFRAYRLASSATLFGAPLFGR